MWGERKGGGGGTRNKEVFQVAVGSKALVSLSLPPTLCLTLEQSEPLSSYRVNRLGSPTGLRVRDRNGMFGNSNECSLTLYNIGPGIRSERGGTLVALPGGNRASGLRLLLLDK